MIADDVRTTSDDVEYRYITEASKARAAVEELMTHSRLAYDTEATGLKVIGGESKLLLMQLGTEDMSYVFDVRKFDPKIMRPVLESPDILKIAHNAKFDYQMTRVHTGIRIANMFDTMLAYRLLTSGLIEDGQGGFVPAGFRDKGRKQFPYKGLNFLTQKYLGITLDKSIRENFINMHPDKEFTEREIGYAAKDVFVLHPLCDILSQELMDEGLIETALLEFKFIGPNAEMELAGVCLDTRKWREIIAQAKKQAKQFEHRIAEMVAPFSEQNTLFGKSTININSPDQLIAVFRKLGFDLEDTDAKTMKKIPHPLAKLLQEYKAYTKLISTYGEAILSKINRHTGRLHFTLHQLGADTGRLSSENPNIQNIPNDKEDQEAEVSLSFRDCFIAAEGKVLLTADYSQCELRILAEVSQDARFLEIFRNDQDLHIITSQQVFGYSDADLDAYLKLAAEDEKGVDLVAAYPQAAIAAYKKVKDCRSKTKTINFGIAYGLSSKSLAERFKLSDSDAEDILNSYFKTYSGIKKWLDDNGRETLRNRYAKTLVGRKKYFVLASPANEMEFKKSKGATRRMGNNHVIQGCNADITKQAITDLDFALRDIEGAQTLFPVHDEIVSECYEKDAQLVAEIKARVMREAFHKFIHTVPVGKKDRVSVSVAKVWAK